MKYANLSIEERLLKAATILIDEGINWTWSLREIADDADVASNVIFRKFKSRENFVKQLCIKWRGELDTALVGFEGTQILMENLRWIVEHRKRVIFLVAESIQENGNAELTPNMLMFLPDFELIIHELKALMPAGMADEVPDDVFTQNILASVHAGLGMLLFEASPYDYSPEENDALMRKIWQKMWQMATGQDTNTAPDYFHS